MNYGTQTRLFSSLLVVFAIGLGSPVLAQNPGGDSQDEEGPSPVELARQIRRNMLKIEEELSKAGNHDPARGEQVRKDIEDMLDTMKQRQQQVVKDIDDIVKQFKSCSGSSEGKGGKSNSNENQNKSRPRDRNQQGKPRDPNDGNKDEQAGKPKPKDGKKPGKQKGGGAEDNSQKEQDPGDKQPGDPREELKAEKVAKINLNEIWGNLPPELRQKLIDRNFDDFTPEYKEQIAEYFKKTGSAPKK
jgi:hypothetical protein